MNTMGLTEFLNLARQRNAFAYNIATIESALNGVEKLLRNAIVLDAGAGGRLKLLRRQMSAARLVIGVDVAYPDLRRNQDVDQRVLGSVERLPVDDESIDCIISVDVLEHLARPDMFFQEAARCLRPSGHMVLFTPNLWSYKSLATRMLPRACLDLAWRLLKGRPGQPYRTFYRANSSGQIARLASAAGLCVQQIHYLNEIPHFFYSYPVLCVAAYLYGRWLKLAGIETLAPYLVCVIRKPDSTTPVQYPARAEAGLRRQETWQEKVWAGQPAPAMMKREA